MYLWLWCEHWSESWLNKAEQKVGMCEWAGWWQNANADIHTHSLFVGQGRPCCSASIWITALCDGVHGANQMFQMSPGLPRSPSLGAPQQDRGKKGGENPTARKKKKTKTQLLIWQNKWAPSRLWTHQASDMQTSAPCAFEQACQLLVSVARWVGGGVDLTGRGRKEGRGCPLGVWMWCD